jgi:hypothetical protein
LRADIGITIAPPTKAGSAVNLPLFVKQSNLWKIISREGLQPPPAMGDAHADQLGANLGKFGIQPLLVSNRGAEAFGFQQG